MSMKEKLEHKIKKTLMEFETKKALTAKDMEDMITKLAKTLKIPKTYIKVERMDPVTPAKALFDLINE